MPTGTPWLPATPELRKSPVDTPGWGGGLLTAGITSPSGPGHFTVEDSKGWLALGLWVQVLGAGWGCGDGRASHFPLFPSFTPAQLPGSHG